MFSFELFAARPAGVISWIAGTTIVARPGPVFNASEKAGPERVSIVKGRSRSQIRDSERGNSLLLTCRRSNPCRCVAEDMLS